MQSIPQRRRSAIHSATQAATQCGRSLPLSEADCHFLPTTQLHSAYYYFLLTTLPMIEEEFSHSSSTTSRPVHSPSQFGQHLRRLQSTSSLAAAYLITYSSLQPTATSLLAITYCSFAPAASLLLRTAPSLQRNALPEAPCRPTPLSEAVAGMFSTTSILTPSQSCMLPHYSIP